MGIEAREFQHLHRGWFSHDIFFPGEKLQSWELHGKNATQFFVLSIFLGEGDLHSLKLTVRP